METVCALTSLGHRDADLRLLADWINLIRLTGQTNIAAAHQT